MSTERDDLAAQLAAFETARSAGDGLAAVDRWRTRVLGAVIGVATAGLLLVTAYLPVTVSLIGFMGGMIGYAIVISLVIAWYLRSRRATARGFSTRYAVGLGGTMLLYVIGVIAATVVEARDWWIWVPAAVLVALPAVIVPAGARR